MRRGLLNKRYLLAGPSLLFPDYHRTRPAPHGPCTSELRIRVRVIRRIDVTLSDQGGMGMMGCMPGMG